MEQRGKKKKRWIWQKEYNHVVETQWVVKILFLVPQQWISMEWASVKFTVYNSDANQV